jgi:hypothetical protein
MQSEPLFGNNNTITDIDNRITVANKCYYGLKNKSRLDYIITQTECKLYKTLLQPVLSCGCESWAVTKEGEN